MVTVADTTPPVVTTPGNLVVEATSAAGAVVSYPASATDIVDGPVVPACAPASGSLFPIGTSTVTCTARDSRNNQASAAFTVTVRDATAPVVTEAATPSTLLWSPNKTMTPVTVSGKVTDVSRIATMTYSVLDEYGYNQPSGTITPRLMAPIRSP